MGHCSRLDPFYEERCARACASLTEMRACLSCGMWNPKTHFWKSLAKPRELLLQTSWVRMATSLGSNIDVAWECWRPVLKVEFVSSDHEVVSAWNHSVHSKATCLPQVMQWAVNGQCTSGYSASSSENIRNTIQASVVGSLYSVVLAKGHAMELCQGWAVQTFL